MSVSPTSRMVFWDLSARQLAALVMSGELGAVDLTFAVEALGRFVADGLCRRIILIMSEHENPLVREGAAMALSSGKEEGYVECRDALRRMVSDPSPGVAQAAASAVMTDAEYQRWRRNYFGVPPLRFPPE